MLWVEEWVNVRPADIRGWKNEEVLCKKVPFSVFLS